MKKKGFQISQSPETEEDLSAFWLITYSDMTTLLLAFFLLIYAFTVMGDQGRESLLDALNLIDKNTPAEELDEPLAALREKADQIAEMMGQEAEEKPWVQATESEVTIGLPAGITFASGSAKLNPAASKHLAHAARVLQGPGQLIRIEGHTDDIPVLGGAYRSNWHLSVARAQTVVQIFVAEGIKPRQIEVAGYADTRPRDTNETPQGRANNRRIEIKLLSSGAAGGEAPAPASAPAPAPGEAG
ncbi:MAG: OmpA family protein [Deltaproteobacteria bacterium]|nr:OmpA family protein [Deltaproteobacteria bacterium]